MKGLYIGPEFYSAIVTNQLSIVVEGVAEIEDRLFNAWIDQPHDTFGDLLDLCDQRSKRARRDLNNWRSTPMYYVGLLAGTVKAYSALYQAEQEQLAIDKNVKAALVHSGNVTKKILAKLYDLDITGKWISHGALAQAVETSESSLTNIMKRLVRSQAVKSEKSGKYTNYHLTSAGKRYYEENVTIRSSGEDIATLAIGLSELQKQLEHMNQKIDRLNSNNATVDINILNRLLENSIPKKGFENKQTNSSHTESHELSMSPVSNTYRAVS